MNTNQYNYKIKANQSKSIQIIKTMKNLWKTIDNHELEFKTITKTIKKMKLCLQIISTSINLQISTINKYQQI